MDACYLIVYQNESTLLTLIREVSDEVGVEFSAAFELLAEKGVVVKANGDKEESMGRGALDRSW